jgi:hypothetical protein
VRRIVYKVVAIVVFAVVLLGMQTIARACPTCGQALGHDTAHPGMAKGFYYSILFMMATPYVVLCTFCGCMYWKVRRTRAARALKADPSIPTGVETPAAFISKTTGSREPVEVG